MKKVRWCIGGGKAGKASIRLSSLTKLTKLNRVVSRALFLSVMRAPVNAAVAYIPAPMRTNASTVAHTVEMDFIHCHRRKNCVVLKHVEVCRARCRSKCPAYFRHLQPELFSYQQPELWTEPEPKRKRMGRIPSYPFS